MAQLTEGTKLGPYTIEKSLPLGRGGMARVYIARLESDGTNTKNKRVALKVAIPQGRGVDEEKAKIYAEAINNEVEILKKLKHPNIVRLYSIPWGTRKDPYIARADQIDGEPWFFAMEFLEGGSLKQLVERRGKLETSEALEIVSQVGLALDYAHTKNVAHLDVKPDNVLFRSFLTDDGDMQAVLVDWGISANIYKMGVDAGSIPFLPPERVRERRGDVAGDNNDRRPQDVYALGVLLYRSLTGKLPFEGKDQNHLESAILNSAPTRPRELNAKIPESVEQLIQDAMEKDPRNRLTVQEFNDRIEELKRDYHVAVSPPPSGHKKPSPGGVRSAGGRRWWILVPLLLLIILGGALFFAMNNGALALGAFMPQNTTTPTRTQVPTFTPAIPIVQPTLRSTTIPPSATRNLNATATLLPSETFTPEDTSTPVPTSTPVASRTPTLRLVTRTPTFTITPIEPAITDTPTPTRKDKPDNSPPPATKEPPAPPPQPTAKPTKSKPPPTPPP